MIVVIRVMRTWKITKVIIGSDYVGSLPISFISMEEGGGGISLRIGGRGFLCPTVGLISLSLLLVSPRGWRGLIFEVNIVKFYLC